MTPHALQELFMTWMMPSFLSAVSAFLLGIIWYHPRVLGTHWLTARGIDTTNLKQNPIPYILSFPLWFLTSLFFTFLLAYMGIDNISELFLMSCLLWVAFAMPPLVMGSLYTGYPFGAVAIDASYQLAGYYALAMTHYVFKVFDLF